MAGRPAPLRDTDSRSSGGRALDPVSSAPQMTVSDPTLRRSSEDFLERLVSQYERPLLQFFRRRLRSEDDACDAAQEVFLRLARPGVREAAQGRERAYLFTTARNLLTDQHRRHSSQGIEAFQPLEEADTLAAADSTEARLICRDTARVLREGLSSMKRKHREVFVLHRFGELGYRQIAARLGISERTVERRMSRALSHLERALERSTGAKLWGVAL